MTPGDGAPAAADLVLAEAVFIAVLGLLGIYLVLGIAGAVSDVRSGRGARKEVLGFLVAVLLLLALGVLVYASHFAPAR